MSKGNIYVMLHFITAKNQYLKRYLFCDTGVGTPKTTFLCYQLLQVRLCEALPTSKVSPEGHRRPKAEKELASPFPFSAAAHEPRSRKHQPGGLLLTAALPFSGF